MLQFLNNDFSELNSWLEGENFSKIFILCDENTNENCLPVLLGNLETDLEYEIIEIEAGEENKNITIATQLWEILSEMNADRKALLLNLGGGVITDLGGFVASTYKRGIRFIHMPTSLLAMCDASIGGKTGIDLNFLKNAVGTFTEPEKIFIYPDFLATLPEDELRSGFAEMLKHGLIADDTLWDKLSNIDEITPENLLPYLERSIEIKQEIVQADFKEQNIRKNLNFGHTLGHALESLYLENNLNIKHGEAVVFGMIAETYISERAGLLNKDEAESVIQTLNRLYPKLETEQFRAQDFVRMLFKDKKNENGKVLFVLLEKIGKAVFNQEVSLENLAQSINFYRNMA